MSQAVEFYGIQIPLKDIKLPGVANIVNNYDEKKWRDCAWLIPVELDKIKSTIDAHEDMFINVTFSAGSGYEHRTMRNDLCEYVLLGKVLNCSDTSKYYKNVYTEMDPTVNPILGDDVLTKMKTLCEMLQIDNVFESYGFVHKICHIVR